MSTEDYTAVPLEWRSVTPYPLASTADVEVRVNLFLDRAVRDHTALTFPQARGRLISTMMREYCRADLAEKLLELEPGADVEHSSARSLASRIAWKLLP